MLKSAPVWAALSAGLLLLAAGLSFPGSFGFSRTAQIADTKEADGFLLSAELPPGINRQRGRDFLFPESPVLYEDGIALARPRSSKKEITNAGRGRYYFSGSKIYFSTSDGGSLAWRVYTLRAPMWSIRESLLLAIWLLGITASAITARLALPCGAAWWTQTPGVAYASLFVSLAFSAVFFCFSSALADEFFLGLLIPAIWAALMGVNALQRHVAGRVGLIGLALLPAAAGYFYYGLNAASDSSFLVAGVIPCSDARIHFLQSAEIALQGTTQHMFNGRFLYPAFHAVLLDLAGLNLLVANLLVSILVMLGLAFTCRLVAKRTGVVGTAIYCLLFWLYFRAHGCGLVMTENLGLLMGVLGFGFLLFSVDSKKIWPIFVSLVFFGLGSVARPGALFILPALALYAGIRVWLTGAGRFRMPTAVGAVFLGLVITAGCFGSNQLLMTTLCRGEGKSFGNFAFTLHGLLNETKWSTSAEASDWNAPLIMEQNIRQIKESPGSLISGVGRAYAETLKKGFLFRFGEEKRFASTGMAMCFLAVLGCWLWKPLRRDSGWILLLSAGILASIPFAPPWDAGERPYAVTEPVQIFLAAAGFAMLIGLVRKAAEALVPRHPTDALGSAQVPEKRGGSWWKFQTERQDMGRMPMLQFVASASSRWVAFWAAFQKTREVSAPGGEVRGELGLIGFSLLCFFLVLPAPLLLRGAGYRHPTPSQSPAFLPGSSLLISQEGPPRAGYLSRANYLDRLSDFQASHPDNARFFHSEPGDFLLAINWRDLETLVLPLSGSWPVLHNPDGVTEKISPVPGGKISP
jgi:hypothetical protein